MGRGPVVAKKKDASNALRQKVFSLHAKLIALAASKGPDPSLNPSLYDAIEKARKDNLPNDNIERAIKKGSGEDINAEQISQITYEGYAPGGVAVYIHTLTDNRNRTAASMRHIFSKFSGNMGESGSVSWMFEYKGILKFPQDADEALIEELVFETAAQDFQSYEDGVQIICAPEDTTQIKEFFIKKGVPPEIAQTQYLPKNTVDVTEFEKALKITKMVEALEEDEDVEDFAMNYQISESLQKEVDDFIEKNTFRT